MKSIRSRLVAAAIVSCGFGVAGGRAADVAPVVVALQQPVASPRAAPDGFEPVSALPPAEREQLPAAPLVMAAYAFVWLMLFGYLWSIWRRLGTVEAELKSVTRRVEEAAKR